MRRKIKQYVNFEQRTIEKFLWFPMQLGEDWRWSEKVKIRQEFILPSLAEYVYGVGDGYWRDLAFVENDTEHVDGTEDIIRKRMPPCKPPPPPKPRPRLY